MPISFFKDTVLLKIVFGCCLLENQLSRNCRGSLPLNSLIRREKCAESEKPVRAAISLIGNAVYLSRDKASAQRISHSTWIGVLPVSCRYCRRK